MIHYSKTSFKNVLLVLCLSMLQVVTYAQSIITGRVVGVDDSPIAGATIE